MDLSATKLSDMLAVQRHEVCDGVHYIAVDCHDYEHFKSLPDAVSFQGQTLGKSAWNSDKELAYYRSDMKLARRV